MRGLVDTDAVVGQRVTLSCETSHETSVDWLKDDGHLSSRDLGRHGYELSPAGGRVHTLTILSASVGDEAKYTCSCRDDVTFGLLLVEGIVLPEWRVFEIG